jgi:murein L,D-transpeptidase YafK
MNRRKLILFGTLAVALVLAWNFRERVGIAFNMVQQRVGKRTVEDRLQEFGDAARKRWASHFKVAGASYPPKRVIFVALKDQRVLEVYSGDETRTNFIRRYPILAASGVPGPKLREGDRQVPEGLYEIESLNPNSAYHVSLRLNYPNPLDRAQAAKEGRTNLGGDIMIHGKSASIGCIAVGDEAAEDLFTLAADIGIKNVRVICSPVDFRQRKNLPRDIQPPTWTTELYQQIAAQLAALPTP